MKIVILDGSAANPGDITWEKFNNLGDVTIYSNTSSDEVISRAKDADIVITNKVKFGEEELNNLPNLKYIGVTATGFNTIDVEACKRHNVAVTNVPEYGSYATMQMTIALILELTNHVSIHNEAVKNGEWIRSENFCFWNKPLMEIYDKTCVIVGFGKIGRRVAATLGALGAKLIVVPHNLPSEREAEVEGVKVTFMSYEEALPLADIITFHVPLTESTNNLFNKDAIKLCKDGVLAINASRGPIINETDVAEALFQGKIGGFACDVIDREPMKENHPFLETPNTIITPHIAWAPRETRQRLLDVAYSNLESFLKNCQMNRIV